MHVQGTIIDAEERMSKNTDSTYLSLRLRVHFPLPLDKDVDVYKQVRIQPGWSPANLLYERLVGVLGKPGKDYLSWSGQKLNIEVDYDTFQNNTILRVINIQLPEYMPPLLPSKFTPRTTHPTRTDSLIMRTVNNLRRRAQAWAK